MLKRHVWLSSSSRSNFIDFQCALIELSSFVLLHFQPGIALGRYNFVLKWFLFCYFWNQCVVRLSMHRPSTYCFHANYHSACVCALHICLLNKKKQHSMLPLYIEAIVSDDGKVLHPLNVLCVLAFSNDADVTLGFFLRSHLHQE